MSKKKVLFGALLCGAMLFQGAGCLSTVTTLGSLISGLTFIKALLDGYNTATT